GVGPGGNRQPASAQIASVEPGPAIEVDGRAVRNAAQLDQPVAPVVARRFGGFGDVPLIGWWRRAGRRRGDLRLVRRTLSGRRRVTRIALSGGRWVTRIAWGVRIAWHVRVVGRGPVGRAAAPAAPAGPPAAPAGPPAPPARPPEGPPEER